MRKADTFFAKKAGKEVSKMPALVFIAGVVILGVGMAIGYAWGQSVQCRRQHNHEQGNGSGGGG